MRIGLVCPYQWDVPGGVQYHVRDLAETLRGMGHHVEILTPAVREESLPPDATFAGRTVPVEGPGRLKDRVTSAMQGVADAFAAAIADRPEDWHMLGRIWTDVPPDPPGGGRTP